MEDKEEPTELEIVQMFGEHMASGEHACDAGVMPWQVALEFNIKCHLPDFPDDWDDFKIHCPVCGSLLLNPEGLYLQEAREVFDATERGLENRFLWISEIHQAGRSGGWLVIVILWPESREKLKEIDKQLPEVEKFIDSKVTEFKKREHWAKAMSNARNEYSVITESKQWEPQCPTSVT